MDKLPDGRQISNTPIAYCPKCRHNRKMKLTKSSQKKWTLLCPCGKTYYAVWHPRPAGEIIEAINHQPAELKKLVGEE